MSSEKSPTILHQEEQELLILDPKNPRSVINILPDAVAEKVRKAREQRPQYFNIPQPELFKRLGEDSHRPDRIDRILRAKFWIEYERVQSHGLKRMMMTNVVGKVIDYNYFKDFYLNLPSRVAWLLCPPIDMLATLEEVLARLYDDFSELADEPLRDEDGEINLKLFAQKLALFRELDARRTGMLVPDSKPTSVTNVQVNVDSREGKNVTATVEAGKMEYLEKRIAELKRKERQLDQLDQPREVQTSPVVVGEEQLDMTRKLPLVSDEE